MKRATTTTSWTELLSLYPGNFNALADDLKISRVSAWEFRLHRHATPPHELLRKLVAVFRKRGTADGSKQPTYTELFRAWRAEAQ